MAGFIHAFKGTHAQLDILFNNAAVTKMRRTETGDGLEMMFQVNYLAPFILTTRLLDVMKRGARVVNIAVPPGGMRLDIEDLQSTKSYSSYRSFFHTKLCLLFFMPDFARQMAGTGVTANAIDPGPGPFKSNLSREAPKLFIRLQRLLAKAPNAAAQNVVHLAAAEDLAGVTGRVFLGRREKPPIPYWQDSALGERLRAATEALVDGRLRHEREALGG